MDIDTDQWMLFFFDCAYFYLYSFSFLFLVSFDSNHFSLASPSDHGPSLWSSLQHSAKSQISVWFIPFTHSQIAFFWASGFWCIHWLQCTATPTPNRLHSKARSLRKSIGYNERFKRQSEATNRDGHGFEGSKFGWTRHPKLFTIWFGVCTYLTLRICTITNQQIQSNVTLQTQANLLIYSAAFCPDVSHCALPQLTSTQTDQSNNTHSLTKPNETKSKSICIAFSFLCPSSYQNTSNQPNWMKPGREQNICECVLMEQSLGHCILCYAFQPGE